MLVYKKFMDCFLGTEIPHDLGNKMIVGYNPGDGDFLVNRCTHPTFDNYEEFMKCSEYADCAEVIENKQRFRNVCWARSWSLEFNFVKDHIVNVAAIAETIRKQVKETKIPERKEININNKADLDSLIGRVIYLSDENLIGQVIAYSKSGDTIYVGSYANSSNINGMYTVNFLDIIEDYGERIVHGEINTEAKGMEGSTMHQVNVVSLRKPLYIYNPIESRMETLYIVREEKKMAKRDLDKAVFVEIKNEEELDELKNGDLVLVKSVLNTAHSRRIGVVVGINNCAEHTRVICVIDGYNGWDTSIRNSEDVINMGMVKELQNIYGKKGLYYIGGSEFDEQIICREMSENEDVIEGGKKVMKAIPTSKPSVIPTYQPTGEKGTLGEVSLGNVIRWNDNDFFKETGKSYEEYLLGMVIGYEMDEGNIIVALQRGGWEILDDIDNADTSLIKDTLFENGGFRYVHPETTVELMEQTKVMEKTEVPQDMEVKEVSLLDLKDSIDVCCIFKKLKSYKDYDKLNIGDIVKVKDIGKFSYGIVIGSRWQDESRKLVAFFGGEEGWSWSNSLNKAYNIDMDIVEGLDSLDMFKGCYCVEHDVVESTEVCINRKLTKVKSAEVKEVPVVETVDSLMYRRCLCNLPKYNGKHAGTIIWVDGMGRVLVALDTQKGRPLNSQVDCVCERWKKLKDEKIFYLLERESVELFKNEDNVFHPIYAIGERVAYKGRSATIMYIDTCGSGGYLIKYDETYSNMCRKLFYSERNKLDAKHIEDDHLYYWVPEGGLVPCISPAKAKVNLSIAMEEVKRLAKTTNGEEDAIADIDKIVVDAMVELTPEEKEEIDKVYYNNPYTIVILKSGVKGITKCLECDTYDRNQGLYIAYCRAKMEEYRLKIRRL